MSVQLDAAVRRETAAGWRKAKRLEFTLRFDHGTRARYAQGCRCDECRAANTAAYHARKHRVLEVVAELGLESRTRGPCPGLGGKGCPIGRSLRADSIGGVCWNCRRDLVWNGLVDAAPARRHLRKLSKRGVGRRSVGAACDVGDTTLQQIVTGRKKRIRKRTSDRILEVDLGAISDHCLVPAGRTQKMLDALTEEYFTKQEVARLLGYKSPQLQIGKRRVLARTEARVERLYRQAVGRESGG